MEAKRFHKAELVKHGKLEGELLENKRTCKDAITIYLTKVDLIHSLFETCRCSSY